MKKLGISVLYVEDEHILRLIYVRVLQKITKKLYVAENGRQGLEMYEKHQPDLVITDIMMPVMNGLEMIERIRKVDKNVRFVIMSAYSETEYFIDAIKMGVNSFLIKPVEIAKFTSLLSELANAILLEKKVRDQELKRKKAEENLRQLNEELEKRIEERTRDLQKEVHDRTEAEKNLLELNLNLEKRVREELRKRQKQQQLLIQKSKLESIGELAAGIAHEINQPLGSISLGLDNILFKIENNADKVTGDYLKEKIGAMFRDIDRIRQIINHVRIFSRDQDAIEIENFDLNEVVRNALSLVSTQYKKHGIQIEIIHGDDCFVRGNKFRMEQVLLNLLSNAKYAVELKDRRKTFNDYRMKIQIATRRHNNVVILEVKDNGAGISRSDMDNIFEPFFTTKDVEDGTGLGLSITYGIIREMKGNIHVSSKVNQYTDIRVEVPVAETERQQLDYDQAKDTDRR